METWPFLFARETNNLLYGNQQNIYKGDFIMDLTKTANEYAKGIEKMTEVFKKKFGELVFDEDVDADVLDLVKSMFGMIEVSTRLVVEQANTIQEINGKLNTLLDK